MREGGREGWVFWGVGVECCFTPLNRGGFCVWRGFWLLEREEREHTPFFSQTLCLSVCPPMTSQPEERHGQGRNVTGREVEKGEKNVLGERKRIDRVSNAASWLDSYT